MCELLTKAVHAHGGLPRWREISSLEGRVAVRSAVPHEGEPTWELAVIASTHLPLICLEDLRPGGTICSFNEEQMRIYRKNGDLLQWRDREDLHAGRERRPALDVDDVFRSSAALWVALNAPFLFTWPGFVTREISGATGECGPVRRLLVGFPPGMAAEAPIAIASFSSDGLMRNMRYAAEPSQVPAPAPAFCATGHVAHDGIVVVGQQHVQSRLPRPDGSADRLALSLEIRELTFR